MHSWLQYFKLFETLLEQRTNINFNDKIKIDYASPFGCLVKIGIKKGILLRSLMVHVSRILNEIFQTNTGREQLKQKRKSRFL